MTTCGDPALETLVDACADWARAFAGSRLGGASAPAWVPPRWLALLGSSGTGKTHAASRLFHWANARSRAAGGPGDLAYDPRTIYWPDFVQQLRAGKSFELRQDMKRWPVLFLDDVGAERDPHGFVAEELNTLLGCRVGKWTLLTSNLTLAALETIDRRIASRLIRGPNRVVTVETIDYALR